MSSSRSELGLKLWSPGRPAQPTDEPDHDICFVHGLNGRRDTTWQARNENQPWPATLLPRKFPSARLFTFGYDATVVPAGPASTGTIASTATDLLRSLINERRATETLHRPIIFVGHSLGGIICKKAITLSRNSAEHDLNTVADSTLGIVFMGTPHQGSGFADFSSPFVSVLNMLWQTGRYTQWLKRGNGTIKEVDEDFRTAVNRSEHGIAIFSFYEGKPLRGTRHLVVPEHSAIFSGCPSQILNTDHRKMVQFRTLEDDGFKKFCGALDGFWTHVRRHHLCPIHLPAQNATAPTPALQGVAISPAPQDAAESALMPQATVKPATSRHVLYFEKNDDFVGRDDVIETLRTLLIDQSRRTVALYGLGGVGKTQVANALAYLVKENKPAYSVFWVPGISVAAFEEAYATIARKLGIEATKDEDVKQLVCNHLSDEVTNPWLLIVDNADDPGLYSDTAVREPGDKTVAHSLYHYLPKSDVGCTLITTRTQSLAFSLAPKQVHLGAFDLSHARDLAERLLSEKWSTLSSDGDGASCINELLKELEYLPLAITQAMAFMKVSNTPAREYLRHLRATDGSRVDLLDKEIPDASRYKEATSAVASTWLISFDHLSLINPDAVALLEFLSQVEPKAVPLIMLPESGSKAKTDAAVYDLVAYSFVSRQGHMLDMHRLVHTAAWSWVSKSGRADEVRRDAVQHMGHIFRTDDYDEHDTWRVYLPHVIHMLCPASTIKTPASVTEFDICYWVGRCLDTEGRTQDSLLYYKVCSRWACDHLSFDDPSRLASEHGLAKAYQANGQIQEAVNRLKHVVHIRKKLPEDHPSRLASEHELARAYQDNGQIQEAVNLLEHVVHIKKKLAEDHPSRLVSEGTLASTLWVAGRRIEARRLMRHVVSKSQESMPNHPYHQQREAWLAYMEGEDLTNSV